MRCESVRPDAWNRKLYGTLFNVPGTPTHVVCPICGKSSSAKTFPAGKGGDIVYQTFQGLGRGKGFRVVARTSGIADRELGAALKPKVFDLVSALAAHGHVTRLEILDSVREVRDADSFRRTPSTDPNVRKLEDQLTAEKKTREFLEREVTDLQLGTSRLLRQWRDAERRNAVSERRIDELRNHTERLVAATRDGVESLQKLRTEMKNADRGATELADHVRKVRAIVESVQGLRVPQKTEPRDTTKVTTRDSAGRRA